jgi:hypothetical protein
VQDAFATYYYLKRSSRSKHGLQKDLNKKLEGNNIKDMLLGFAAML